MTYTIKTLSRSIILILFAMLYSFLSCAIGPDIPIKDLKEHPPKIIRTCCAFGSDVKVAAVPLKTITNITSVEKLGNHVYLGDKAEGNGIIYTQRGGFIDIGHLRDLADWTAYLYTLIQHTHTSGGTIKKLGYEGGRKTLELNLPEHLSDADALLLAGRIAYDLSVWHEIGTWFGTSYLPFVPERYSSFSIEDNYSNLLGVTIGMKAIRSELSYETAMTRLIDQTLSMMQAVDSEEGTYAAMEEVEGIWWTREERFPKKEILLERYMKTYDKLTPWTIIDWDENRPPIILAVPDQLKNGQPLSNFYQLSFKLNRKFPMKRLFPDREDRVITQEDFDVLITWIKIDLKDEIFTKTHRKKRNQKITR